MALVVEAAAAWAPFLAILADFFWALAVLAAGAWVVVASAGVLGSSVAEAPTEA